MATHSSVLAWRIPGTGEPGGLPSMGSHRVGHDWSDLAAAAVSMSYSLWPHGQHLARIPCPSPSPGVCSDSCPSSWWCHPTISTSVTTFSSCPQSFFFLGSHRVGHDWSDLAAAAACLLLLRKELLLVRVWGPGLREELFAMLSSQHASNVVRHRADIYLLSLCQYIIPFVAFTLLIPGTEIPLLLTKCTCG